MQNILGKKKKLRRSLMCLGPKTHSLEVPKSLHAQVLDNPAGEHSAPYLYTLDCFPFIYFVSGFPRLDFFDFTKLLSLQESFLEAY